MVDILIRGLVIAVLAVAAIGMNWAAIAYDRKLARPRRDERIVNVANLCFSMILLWAIVANGSMVDIIWALPLTTLMFGSFRLIEAYNWVRVQRQLQGWDDDEE